MCNTVVKNVVGEDDLRVVHISGAIGQDSEGQARALERRNRDIAQGWGENDVVGDDVQLKNLLERGQIGCLEHGANILEGHIVGDENSEVGEVEAWDICASQADVDSKLACFQCCVHGFVACSPGEELEGRTE